MTGQSIPTTEARQVLSRTPADAWHSPRSTSTYRGPPRPRRRTGQGRQTVRHNACQPPPALRSQEGSQGIAIPALLGHTVHLGRGSLGAIPAFAKPSTASGPPAYLIDRRR